MVSAAANPDLFGNDILEPDAAQHPFPDVLVQIVRDPERPGVVCAAVHEVLRPDVVQIGQPQLRVGRGRGRAPCWSWSKAHLRHQARQIQVCPGASPCLPALLHVQAALPARVTDLLLARHPVPHPKLGLRPATTWRSSSIVTSGWSASALRVCSRCCSIHPKRRLQPGALRSGSPTAPADAGHALPEPKRHHAVAGTVGHRGQRSHPNIQERGVQHGCTPSAFGKPSEPHDPRASHPPG